MTDTRLEFGVLGPLRVSADAGPIPLGTPKQRAVMAMLVINRNRPVAVDSLIGAVWEETPPPGARASLHTYISNLRGLLSTAAHTSRDILLNAPPGYRLNVAEQHCDIGRFAMETSAGMREAAARRFEQASQHFSAALAQWRGAILEDLRSFQFVEAFAAALVEQKIVAYTARAEAEIACGRSFTVIGELETLLAEHPYREPLWAQMITAYYLAGRQSDALNAYHRLKTTLADELGIDPNPTVQSLYERILRQEALDVKAAAKTTAVDAMLAIDQRSAVKTDAAYALLRDTSDRTYLLQEAGTRVGRLPDNDIVLDDANVSRHHAVVIDTGTTFMITDLKSANGVEVQHQQIHGTATLTDGDVIRIGRHEFTFEIKYVREQRPPSAANRTRAAGSISRRQATWRQ
jgi:SARP family transcriptional regulator, regulator of embCAB operon